MSVARAERAEGFLAQAISLAPLTHSERAEGRLVLDRENLLSYERFHDVVSAWPRSYWLAVDAPDERWTGPANPCVYVPKQ